MSGPFFCGTGVAGAVWAALLLDRIGKVNKIKFRGLPTRVQVICSLEWFSYRLSARSAR